MTAQCYGRKYQASAFPLGKTLTLSISISARPTRAFGGLRPHGGPSSFEAPAIARWTNSEADPASGFTLSPARRFLTVRSEIRVRRRSVVESTNEDALEANQRDCPFGHPICPSGQLDT